MLWSHREREIILNFPVIYTVVGSIIHTQLLKFAKFPIAAMFNGIELHMKKTFDWPLIDSDNLRSMKKSWK